MPRSISCLVWPAFRGTAVVVGGGLGPPANGSVAMASHLLGRCSGFLSLGGAWVVGGGLVKEEEVGSVEVEDSARGGGGGGGGTGGLGLDVGGVLEVEVEAEVEVEFDFELGFEVEFHMVIAGWVGCLGVGSGFGLKCVDVYDISVVAYYIVGTSGE